MLSDASKRLKSIILDLDAISEYIRARRSATSRTEVRGHHPQGGGLRVVFDGMPVNHLPGELLAGNNSTKFAPRRTT